MLYWLAALQVYIQVYLMLMNDLNDLNSRDDGNENNEFNDINDINSSFILLTLLNCAANYTEHANCALDNNTRCNCAAFNNFVCIIILHIPP